MRVSRAAAWVSATLCLLAAFASTTPLTDAAAVKAGAPEHLSTGVNMCARTFHSKGAVGCRSLSSDARAPLFPIASADDLAQFVKGDAAGQTNDETYVLVLPESLVSFDALSPGLDRIGGLFAYPTPGAANASFGSPTPQGAGTVDGALNPFTDVRIAWNRNGNALLEREVPFPVVLLESEAAGQALDARARLNLKAGAGATYTALLSYYFGPPEMTSLKCLAFTNVYGKRSPKCDPIGGQSAYSVRGPANSPIVLATAAMDATALAHVQAPGANSAASGLVALLAAAKALSVVPDSALSKRIVFAAFQAERFGFVGSRKFLSDLQTFKTSGPSACKARVNGSVSPLGTDFCTQPMLSSLAFADLSLDDIAYAIAVDQVGVLPPSGNFSIHVNPFANSSSPTANSSKLVDTLTTVPAARGHVAIGTVRALPPTPLTTFVNANEFGKRDLVAAVLAGYDTEFNANASFSSRHDVRATVDATAVTHAAQVLAEALYELAATAVSADVLKQISVSESDVAELLTCVSSNWRCDLMVNVSTPFVKSMIAYLDLTAKSWPSYAQVPTLYAGPIDAKRLMRVTERKSKDETLVYTQFNSTWDEDVHRVYLFPNAFEVFTRSFLAAATLDSETGTSAPTCVKNQDCRDSGRGFECVFPGKCAPQQAHFHFAISPGLARTAQFGVYDVVNASMPLWTEPQWDMDIGSYVFPDPGELIGWLTLAIGVVVTAVSVVLARLFLASVHKMKLL